MQPWQQYPWNNASFLDEITALAPARVLVQLLIWPDNRSQILYEFYN